MRSPLRWRILLFTAVPIVALAMGTLWVVNRTVSRQVHDNVEQDLRRAAVLFEDMLAERAEQLCVTSDVIVRDPRFFSALALPGSHRDPVFRNTVTGVARDFNAITHADVFAVYDARGRAVASVGRDRAEGAAVAALVRSALEGRTARGVLVSGRGHFQGAATPVIAGRRTVGVLVVGARVGQELAEKLRDLTRSDVSFVSAGVISGSTLARAADREAVLAALEPGVAGAGAAAEPGRLVELAGPGDTDLALLRRLPESGDGAGQYYSIQRSLRAETAFLRGIQAGLVQLGLLAVLLAMLAGFVVSARITQPLRRIVRAAEEIERGNYEYPLAVGGADEIGYLAQRFDEMRRHERVYVHSLKEVARLKSEFISVASHELRTPISVIKGFQELLAHGMLGALSEDQKAAVRAIGDGTATLERIADDATRVAQIEGERLMLDPGDHDIADLLTAAVRQVTAEARGRQVQVTLETDRSLPRVRVDGERLTEAVANLVRNGIRFTPDGGRVEVRSAWRDPELEIEVVDSGVGIAPERRQQIFERGLAVRDSRNHHSSKTLEFNSAGLGLGLAIARGIVEAHGGTIAVESAPGGGSRFVLRLRPERAEGLRAAA
jgi:signal transduction histidine kinase